jgi:hypothetical protein
VATRRILTTFKPMSRTGTGWTRETHPTRGPYPVARCNIAVFVDRASAVLDPTTELLEASHAIHRALIVLSEWCHLTGAGRRIDA